MRDKSAFDLFQGLAALGSRDFTWFSKLSDEGKKAASPFVIMRWMSGTNDFAQIIKLNTLANPYMFVQGFDKNQQFTMLAASATGKTKRYQWLKMPGQKNQSVSIDIIKRYYDCTTREAKSYKVKIEDLMEMAIELGLEKDEIDKLKKEHNVTGADDKGSASKRSTKSTGKPKR